MVSMVLGQGTGPTGRPGLGTHRWLGTSTDMALELVPGPLGRHGQHSPPSLASCPRL